MTSANTFEWNQVGAGLADSVTLIAGGARGTGATIAENLLQLGGSVAVCDINPKHLDDARDRFASHGDRILMLTADCTVASDVTRVAAETSDQFGRLTNMVYAAGAYRAQRPTLEISADEWDLIVDSNLKGAFLTAQAVIPHMINAGGGAIVSISSLAGRTTSPFLGVHYTAAKAGILGLTRHIAKEFGHQNIRANSICPGGITGQRMNDLLHDLHRESDLVQLADQTPLGRNVEELDVAGVVLFLLSDLSRFVTGATVDVNGGILTI
ncbi:SDR family NAD(P)-dependent oxidoreductase [Microbacterium murale]|uniref:Oxidoreductase n=1 Tax=Microbacterium murale TaxID=1081040 RepID=A0ABQ1RJP8_9MICO|nr:SDR family NAD(P)-dependent oxidoreductase [Microbacterium murale]GGD70183.1 oxidoreductase [Microbacterium murale]